MEVYIRTTLARLVFGCGLGFRVRLECMYINRGIYTHHFLRDRVRVGVRTVAFPPGVSTGIPTLLVYQ